jgi:hypothetical protein
MSMNSSHPRCRAKLRDGSACRTHADAGSDYCAYHSRQVATPADRRLEETPTVDQEPQPTTAFADGSRRRGVPVAEVRAQLARDTAEEYELLRTALLEALRARREAFATCPNCGKRHPVQVPDWTARVKAVETLLNQGFGGKPEPVETEHDRHRRELSKLQSELGQEEWCVFCIAHAAHGLETRLRSTADRARRREQTREPVAAGTTPPQPKAAQPQRERLRLFLIELFDLDEDQVRLFHRLLNASPRIWWFLDELREVMHGEKQKR